ncbi:MAG: hypothetical protein V4760_05460 [Bdellovibrionota bacterium]
MSRAELEWAMLKDFVFFAKRNLRYGKIALALYFLEFKLGRRAFVARLGFVFLQVIDDLLDGDRACAIEPYEEIAQLLQRAERGRFDLSRPLDRLGAALWVEMGRNAAGEEGVAKTLEIIRVMMRDRKRVTSGEIWLEADLREQHRRTFAHSLDLTLIAIESPLRASDVPALLDLLGWCSTVRDLEEDLSRGLCNLPREVVPSGAIEMSWVRSDGVSAWFESEYRRVEGLLVEAEAQIARHEGKSGLDVFVMFRKSIASFHARQKRRTVSAPLESLGA